MQKRRTRSNKEKILKNLLSGKAKPRYEGKEVVIFDGKIYVLPDDGKEAAKLIEKLETKKPGEIPTITFVPRKGSYILILS